MAHRPGRLLRVAALSALALAGCGLAHHDVTVSQDFVAGGGPPTATVAIDSSKLTAPLSASAGELSKLSSVTLQSARLASTDSGDLAYVSGVSLVLTAAGYPDVALATLPAAPAAGVSDVALQADSKTDLRPYLATGGVLNATVTYGARPVAARGLRLTLVIRGSL